MLSYDPKFPQLKQSFLKNEKCYQFPDPTMQTLFGLDIFAGVPSLSYSHSELSIKPTRSERTLECFVREATPPSAIGHLDGENSVDSAYGQLVGVITGSSDSLFVLKRII